MKRKIYARLLEWKERKKGSTALLIEGARRVGKSLLVEEFGRNETISFSYPSGYRCEQSIYIFQ